MATTFSTSLYRAVILSTLVLLASSCGGESSLSGQAESSTGESTDGAQSDDQTDETASELDDGSADTEEPATASSTVIEQAAEPPSEAVVRPSKADVAAALTEGIQGTPAGEELTAGEVSCIAGILVESQLSDAVLVSLVTNTVDPTVSADETELLGDLSKAATITCAG